MTDTVDYRKLSVWEERLDMSLCRERRDVVLRRSHEKNWCVDFRREFTHVARRRNEVTTDERIAIGIARKIHAVLLMNPPAERRIRCLGEGDTHQANDKTPREKTITQSFRQDGPESVPGRSQCREDLLGSVQGAL